MTTPFDEVVHVNPKVDKNATDFHFDIFQFRIEKEFSDKLRPTDSNRTDRSFYLTNLNKREGGKKNSIEQNKRFNIDFCLPGRMTRRIERSVNSL